MSLRLEMLQVARLGPKLLGDSAELVRKFLVSQQNADGGFKDRAGRSDLYYTVFGIEGLLALQTEWPIHRVDSYLRGFGTGEGLDFVHLCCLARSWAGLGNGSVNETAQAGFRREMLGRIEAFRTQDGGYHPNRGSESGTAYGCFLAWGAYQDLNTPFPNSGGLVRCLAGLETGDGAWANERHIKSGSTNATAAVTALLRQLEGCIQPGAGDWLLARCHAQGGFLAMPQAPLPDLLSTATGLHALAGLQVSFASVRECCLDFIDSLWSNEGGFHGHWQDDALDCEYTFYGLLALGHLVLEVG